MSNILSLAKWSIDDYHQMIQTGILDDRRVELFNGEIVEMSPEGEPHAYYRTEAKDYLKSLLGDRIKIRDAAPITLPNTASELEPDIAIVQPLGREYLQHHPYPENIFWVIEFSDSSLAKDLNPKAKVYAEAGLAEYWVINLRSMELIVMREPVEGKYRDRITLTSGTISPLAFPDVLISVAQLLT